MANIYKIRMSGRGTTVVGSTLSQYLTGRLVGVSWPGVGSNSTERYSTGSVVTFSVTPRSSEQQFLTLSLGEKSTGNTWYPTVRHGSSVGGFRGTSDVEGHHLPLCRDRIKMNYGASTHKSCAHLDMDLYIDGPPGLMGATDYNN